MMRDVNEFSEQSNACIQRPIGVFDSGVGGLSVLAHIRAQLPHEQLIYVADSAYLPYGCKSEEVVRERCMRIFTYLLEADCKAVVVACNTATAVSIHAMREMTDLPVIGMEPAVKPALLQSKAGVVGVLATSATAVSRKFANLVARFAGDGRVIVQPCPGLVEKIEAGDAGLSELLHHFISPLLAQGVDTLVLGCSHYPLVLREIEAIAGADIAVIDAGDAIAAELSRQLERHQLLCRHDNASTHFFSSGQPQVVETLMSRLWGEQVVVQSLPV